jgi:hypothetical protein
MVPAVVATQAVPEHGTLPRIALVGGALLMAGLTLHLADANAVRVFGGMANNTRSHAIRLFEDVERASVGARAPSFVGTRMTRRALS